MNLLFLETSIIRDLYALGFDIGSSSIKAAILDIASNRELAVVKYPENELEISSPKPEWAEQDPETWWRCAFEAYKILLHSAKINAAEIKCIGLSYQMHGLVVVDQSGQVVRPSIIWCDSRAVAAGDILKSRIAPDYIENNLFNEPGNFTASKIFWLKENEPEQFARVFKLMLPGDYIAYKFSGTYTTSLSGLSEGVLWDFTNNAIADPVLAAISPNAKELIPTIYQSFEKSCFTTENIEKEWGIRKGTPVSYRAGDQPNNAFSLGVVHPGQAAGTGGTSGVIYALSKDIKKDPSNRVNSFAHVNHGNTSPCIGTLLCINGSGILYNWVRRQFYPGNHYSEIEKFIKNVPPGSEGLLLMPFGNGAERILNNKQVSASITGLHLNRHDRSHIARASLEGIAFAFYYGIKILRSLGIPCKAFRVGNDNLFLSKVFSESLASISESEIHLMKSTGAVGAARGAAFGAGFYNDLDETLWGIEEITSYSPVKTLSPLKEYYNRWEETLAHKLSEYTNK